MTTLSILVGVCNCILGFYKLEALGVLGAPLSLALWIVAKLL